jgi:lipoprotein-releasing system permease protein
MSKYFLALKYLLRRPINLLGAIGVTIAVWAFVLTISVFSGFITQVRDQIRGEQPELSLIADSVSESPESYSSVVERLLEPDPDIAAHAPRILFHGLLYFEEGVNKPGFVHSAEFSTLSSNYFTVAGIDFDQEVTVTGIHDWLLKARDTLRVEKDAKPFEVTQKRSQRDLGGRGLPGLLIGDLRTAGLRPMALRGDQVVLMSARQVDGKVKVVERHFALTGSYRSQHHDPEVSTAFVDIEELRSVFGHDLAQHDSVDVFSEISIALKPGVDMNVVRDRLNAGVAELGIKAKVLSWEDRNARFLGAVEHERSLMTLVMFAFMVVATFLIFATVSMMVARKTRDIGILSALGGTRSGVTMLFLTCGGAISIGGTLFGIAAGCLSVVKLNTFNLWLNATFGLQLFPFEIFGLSQIPYVLDPVVITQIGLGTIATALLFSLLPALRAARLDPVQALRYE